MALASFAGSGAVVNAVEPASPRRLMRDRRRRDDVRGWLDKLVRLRALVVAAAATSTSSRSRTDLRLLSLARSLRLTRCHQTRDTVVDRSSLDVARGGDSHGRSPFVSFPLSSPSPRSLPLHRSFALLRLFYSLTSQTCYASTLTQYDALKPGEAGSLGAWCDDAGFTSAMKRCWDQNCQWDAACSYAASTSSMWDKAHSSVAAKVATKPRNTVLPLVTSTVTPSTSATAIAIAQSDTVRLASSASTSGALKLLCTSLFALIGAVILAVVVFLEAGPSL
ncbi:Integral membrane protein [Rhodotorula toruloides]|nr:Integral membrane protein [Rhodotorula toruloides]